VNLDLPIKPVGLRRRIGDAAGAAVSEYRATGNIANSGGTRATDGERSARSSFRPAKKYPGRLGLHQIVRRKGALDVVPAGRFATWLR
jgi:hypothetical protein